MSVNKFGRIVAPPEASDWRFQMRLMRRQVQGNSARITARKRPYRDGPLLDQGPTPHCVGYSCRGFLTSAPMMSKPDRGISAVRIYKDAQERDEWGGNNYDGTSVRGGMKALVDAEEVGSYVWGHSVAEAIAWMNDGFGTIVVGTNWYIEMSDVDKKGFMQEPPRSTTPIGGHAWRWIWYDKKREGILMRNSWGSDFGIIKTGRGTGYAYLRLELAERLLREDGEIASAVQIKLQPSSIGSLK